MARCSCGHRQRRYRSVAGDGRGLAAAGVSLRGDYYLPAAALRLDDQESAAHLSGVIPAVGRSFSRASFNFLLITAAVDSIVMLRSTIS